MRDGSNLIGMSRRTLLASFLLAAALPAAEPDWPAVKSEALETLVELVRLDTAQPEGNEIRAARYLREKLDREGLPSEIFEAAPGRASARMSPTCTPKSRLIWSPIGQTTPIASACSQAAEFARSQEEEAVS